MDVFLHTIALEPARWTAQRVSRPLAEILPAIARAGFRQLEVFEPHLALAPDEAALPSVLSSLGLEPVMLSSYINVNSAVTADVAFEQDADALEARVRRFGFRKVRLFPGPGVLPTDEPVIAVVQARIAALARRLPEAEFLLESHDGSIADDPERLVRLVCDMALPNVGILFQPTVFEAQAALSQVECQAPWVRHLHLQNRAVGDKSRFVRLAEGGVSWKEIVAKLHAHGAQVAATLEFVPSAICPVEAFDLERSLAEAVEEVNVFQSL